VTEGREWTSLRHLDRLREMAMLQATRICIILDINNIETIADSRGTGRGPLQPNPAGSLSGLRARLRLERRLLRFKDRNGLWWAKLSSVIIFEMITISDKNFNWSETLPRYYRRGHLALYSSELFHM
jgi:hypothetical protein